MEPQRSSGMRMLLLAARFAILAGIVVGITGVAQVVAEGAETGSWQPEWLFVWIALGALPYVGGTLTGQMVRGPGDRGLRTVASVTTVLGVIAVVVWVLEGISRR